MVTLCNFGLSLRGGAQYGSCGTVQQMNALHFQPVKELICDWCRKELALHEGMHTYAWLGQADLLNQQRLHLGT